MVKKKFSGKSKYFGTATNVLADMFINKIVDFGTYSPVYTLLYGNGLKAEVIAADALLDVTARRQTLGRGSKVFICLRMIGE